jgi:anaerobic ribonucleoside-triphosphate reductase activating protein
MIEKKNITLRFRGSENQRIIDMKETRKTGSVVLKME